MVEEKHVGYLTGFPHFDSLFGPMLEGNIYLLVGRAPVSIGLVDRMVVLCAQEAREVCYIDGGHGANPFSMARVLRMQRTDPRPVLQRVRIARAFTAYQMDALLNEELEKLPRAPALLTVSALDSLFTDPEVDPDEAKGMLRNCMDSLIRVSEKGTCVVLTGMGGARGSDLLTLITPHCTNWASFTKRQGNRVRIVTRGGLWKDLVPLHPFQTMMEDFGDGGPESAVEVG